VLEYKDTERDGGWNTPVYFSRYKGEDPFDPIYFQRCLEDKYRIKPRVVRWYIEFADDGYDVSNCLKNLSKWMGDGESCGFASWFTEAIRNAKPLPEENNV